MNDFEDGSHAVLFVDDEEKSRKYFALGVQPLFPVLTASSVEEGIGILQRDGHRIGVLITDQRMPGGNGVEILRYARENHPGIVRLLTTAYSDLEEAVSAVNSGEIVRYIRKPWQFDDLLQDIRQAMGYFTLGLERDKLLAEKLSLRRVDVLVQQVSALVELAGTVWDTRAPMSALRAFLEDAVHNHWLLGDDEGQAGQQHYEQWRWIADRLQRSFELVDTLDWSRRAADGFGSVVDASALAALIKTHGSWRDDAGDAGDAAGAVTVALNQAMLEGLVAGLIGRPDGPLAWLNGMLACSITAATDGLEVEIRASAATEVAAIDFYTAMPLLGLYLFAHHHGGRCGIEHSRALIRLELPSDPAAAPAADEAGLDWLQDLLGELVLVARVDD